MWISYKQHMDILFTTRIMSIALLVGHSGLYEAMYHRKGFLFSFVIEQHISNTHKYTAVKFGLV